MRYDRKIKYFDYIKDGERINSVGFLKINVRDNTCAFLIQISGLHVTDTFCKEIYLIGGEREAQLGFIELQGGKGMLQLELSTNDLCQGISYENLESVRIPIGAGRELRCQIADKQLQKTEEAEWQRENRQKVNWGNAKEKADTEENSNTEERLRKAEKPSREKETSKEERQSKKEEASKEEETSEKEETSEEERKNKKKKEQINNKQMLSTKWSQITAIYPHINPFEDEREYLRIGPQDFVVLNQRYYQLVHNSFLLHGYYNYQHLILARMELRGEVRYYIGVPGNFYEREKQVAMMFGFESFECKEEPADNGDYGYYMIRVEL